MIWDKIGAIFVGPIIDGVLKGLSEHRALKQFEDMQAEILEGWMFRVKYGIMLVLKKHNIPHTVFNEVSEKVDEVVREQFDTRKL